MAGELSAAHEAARQAPSKTMQTLVEKLRNQLSAKEKQHQVEVELGGWEGVHLGIYQPEMNTYPTCQSKPVQRVE